MTRAEALNILHSASMYHPDYLYLDALNMAIKALEQEPRKGHWIEHPHEWGDNWQYSRYECSCCHNWAYHDTDYCPNCGAKIGEEE